MILPVATVKFAVEYLVIVAKVKRAIERKLEVVLAAVAGDGLEGYSTIHKMSFSQQLPLTRTIHRATTSIRHPTINSPIRR